MEEKRIALYQKLKEQEFYTKSYSEFIQQFFTSTEKTDKLFDACITNETFTKPKKVWYEKFCCDLDWAKTTTYCGGTPVIPPTPDPDEKKKTNDPTPKKTTTSTCPSTTATEDDVKNGKEFIKNCVQGDIVTTIQKHLKKHGFHDISKTGNPDGIFGSRTEGSIQAFQREKKLVVDGVVGPKTWAELVKDKSSTTTTPVIPVKKTKPDDILAVDDITYDL